MKPTLILGVLLVLIVCVSLLRQRGQVHATVPERDPGVYGFTLRGIDGKDLPLSHFSGKVLLIVNVASKCGFTKQYTDLEALYETYGKKGLVVLGVPSNDFGGQEPGTETDIQAFCRTTYGVSFPMTAKLSVKGKDMHPLYRYLTAETGNRAVRGPVTWNFNKFLVGPDGRVVARYGSMENPSSKKVVSDILGLLEE